jgi:membrane protease YdiL (CAAX protease family)
VKPDPFLLSCRVGRWRWPWAVAGTALTLALIIAIGFVTEPLEIRLAAAYGAASPGTDLLPGRPDTFLSFVLFALSVSLAPALVAIAVHGLDPRRLLGPGGRFDWNDFAKGAAALIIVMGLGVVVALFREPENLAWTGRGLADLPWLALALPVILFQSFSEEYLFKGYLVRVWGAVVPIRSLIVVAVAALFSAAHAINTDVAQDLAFNLGVFFILELFTLAVYLRTESLAGVTGLHWMNNVWAMCVMATSPGQSTELALAVYRDPILSSGASRLTEPWAYLEVAAALALLAVMLFWRRSPLYIEPARPAQSVPHGN